MLRSFFIKLSTNKAFRSFSEQSSMGRKVSRRFVAGMSVEEAFDAAPRSTPNDNLRRLLPDAKLRSS